MTKNNDISDPIPRDFRAATDDLYDIFREARMNVKYYGELLAKYQKWNFWLEVVIAVGTSTTLMSLPFFSTDRWLTGTLGTIAAVFGVLKPLLSFPKKIERASSLWAGYQGAFISAQSIIRDVRLRQTITAIDEHIMREIHDKMDSLCLHDDPCPKSKDIDRLQAEVEVAYPPDQFWYPSATIQT